MYGPGYPHPPPPYYGYPPQPIIIQKGGGKGRGRGPKNQPMVMDPIAAIQKLRDDADKLEKMFKKEEKKEDKKESFFLRKQLSLLETIGLQFVLLLPTTFVLWAIFKSVAR